MPSGFKSASSNISICKHRPPNVYLQGQQLVPLLNSKYTLRSHLAEQMLKPHLLIWVSGFQFVLFWRLKTLKSLTLKGGQKVSYAVNIEVRDHFLLRHAVTFLITFHIP